MLSADDEREIQSLLQHWLPKLDANLPENLDTTVLQYLGLLQKWNRTYNLTAIDEPVNMVFRHVLDSLSVLPHLHGDRILDVGAGAGLPGILLALARPEKNFVLLDSNGKKTRFMTQACLELKITNATVVHSRIETYQPEQLFSTITSRAYSNLTRFYQQTVERCENGGRILAMKGRLPQEELDELRTLIVAEVINIDVPGLQAERHFVIIRKPTDT